MHVRASRTLREVVATYVKDEAALEMVVRLPPSYPLQHLEAECTKRIGVGEGRLRKWLLSINLFLRNQNGTLAEAIEAWRETVEKLFEGVEPCPICYSVVAYGDRSLPRLKCRTCPYKFHSACLMKWFSTSHKSTCPMCKSPMSF